MAEPIRVLIVDDHPVVRQGLRSFLLTIDGIDVVGEAADGDEATKLAAALEPDVVLMDLAMPGVDGIEATRRITEASSTTKVIALTSFATDDKVFPAIRAGAAGYLLKTEPPERIAEFLHGVVHGEAALSGSIARRLLDRVRTGSDHVGGVPDSIARRLSARELEVLLLLDEHLGTDEISKRLYISEHTVRSHVKSLLRKLGVSSRREALEQLSLARAA